ncbi:putative serine protease PepD [Actinomycetospora succinea]|uniref:Putative serine protease PepD n=2 Tax=Actinomycetospora succinea TaxID=663603 RepID=A0A4R6VQV1_9PSEU|nr:trypsin-like peptidase domain-containing protein [Actinomycetospora succinea]TDQ64907.1 putative serine protease PepD [Actinomycetospora succinea]
MSENDAAPSAADGPGPAGTDAPGGSTSASPAPEEGSSSGPGGVRWAEGTGREYETARVGTTDGATPYSAPSQAPTQPPTQAPTQPPTQAPTQPAQQPPPGLGQPPSSAGATAAFGAVPAYPATAPQTREMPPGGFAPPTSPGAPGTGWGAASPGPATPPGGWPRDPGAGWGGPGPGGGGPGGPGAPRRRGTLGLVALALVAGLIGGVIGAAVVGGFGGSSSSSQGTALEEPVPESEGPAPAPGSVEAIAANVLPSAVQIRGQAGEGSGIVLSADGLIMTNNHVLQAGQGGGLEAIFSDGRAAPVQVVGTAPAADIAVVRASGVTNLRAASLGNSDELVQGQPVMAVGSPLGLSGTVTTGIVSALQRPVEAGGSGAGQSSVLDAIQTDAAINPGNSGGPLVDFQGRVIGVNTAIASVTGGSGQEGGSIGLGFAIPINQARRLATELVDTGQATQAVIGVGVANAAPRGAAMADVAPGSPAAAAGVAAGDVVVGVDNRVIEDANAFVAAIQSRAPGQTVTLTLQAPGGTRQVTVTLGSRVIGGR